MKFFTKTWFKRFLAGNCTDEEVAKLFETYSAHIKSISLQFTPELVELHQISLHDALFKELACDSERKNISLVLRCGDLQTGYFDLHLEYKNAEIASNPFVELRSIIGNKKHEIMYDEIDVIDKDKYEHAFLVYPECEITVKFSNLVLRRYPMPDRGIV